MKKVCFLILTIVININAFAEKIKGYYIDNSNQKIEVIFRVPMVSFYNFAPDYAIMQKGIRAKDSNKKKHKIKPSNAKEIVFIYNKQEVRMINKTINKKQLFLRQVEKGKMNLYYFYKKTYLPVPMAGSTVAFTTAGSGSVNTKRVFIEKEENVLIRLSKKEFDKKSQEVFAGCQSVLAKIQAKEYKFKQMKQAVADYNSVCN